MERLVHGLTKYGAWVVAFCLGVIGGVLIKWPAGWQLPDTTANLLGGVVGAFGSVAGALMVLKRQKIYEREEAGTKQQQLLQKLAGHFRKAVASVHSRFKEISKERFVEADPGLPNAIELLRADLTATRSDLERDRALLASIDDDVLARRQVLELYLQLLDKQLSSMLVQYAAPPHFDSVQGFVDERAIFTQSFNSLIDELASCNPDGEFDKRRLPVER